MRSVSEVRKCYFDHWLASRVSDSQVHIGAISLSKKISAVPRSKLRIVNVLSYS